MVNNESERLEGHSRSCFRHLWHSPVGTKETREKPHRIGDPRPKIWTRISRMRSRNRLGWLLTHVLQVRGSNLRRDVGNNDLRFIAVFLSPSRHMSGQSVSLQIHYDSSFTLPFSPVQRKYWQRCKQEYYSLGCDRSLAFCKVDHIPGGCDIWPHCVVP